MLAALRHGPGRAAQRCADSRTPVRCPPAACPQSPASAARPGSPAPSPPVPPATRRTPRHCMQEHFVLLHISRRPGMAGFFATCSACSTQTARGCGDERKSSHTDETPKDNSARRLHNACIAILFSFASMHFRVYLEARYTFHAPEIVSRTRVTDHSHMPAACA
jgi:hypothetical protein